MNSYKKLCTEFYDLDKPGVKINTSPTDYLPIEQMQLCRFDGQNWVGFGDLLGR